MREDWEKDRKEKKKWIEKTSAISSSRGLDLEKRFRFCDFDERDCTRPDAVFLRDREEREGINLEERERSGEEESHSRAGGRVPP